MDCFFVIIAFDDNNSRMLLKQKTEEMCICHKKNVFFEGKY